MASPQAALIDELFDSFSAKLAANPDMGVDELRDMLEKCGDIARDPDGVDYIEEEIAGTTCLWARPKGADETRVLLCFHGGGCVTGSRFSHRKLYAHLAKATGCQALIPEYGRAPEHQFPSQLDEGLAVYEALLGRGIAASRIALTGDSAGGNLCTAVTLAARDRGVALPAAVMPMSPWYDMEACGDSFKSNEAVDRLISAEMSLGISALYLGDTSPKNPLANPLYADYKGFPPTYIQVGGHEALLDDATRAAASMKAAGVDMQCDVFPEMQHVFQFMAGNAPEADDAIKKLAAWVRPRLGMS